MWYWTENTFKFFQVITSSHNDLNNNRQNLDFCCRSTLKATNLSLTVVSLFVVTNLPYVVDEFIRQKILTDAWCDSTFCDTVEVPFLFFWLFTKYLFIFSHFFDSESSLHRAEPIWNQSDLKLRPLSRYLGVPSTKFEAVRTEAFRFGRHPPIKIKSESGPEMWNAGRWENYSILATSQSSRKTLPYQWIRPDSWVRGASF